MLKSEVDAPDRRLDDIAYAVADRGEGSNLVSPRVPGLREAVAQQRLMAHNAAARAAGDGEPGFQIRRLPAGGLESHNVIYITLPKNDR